MQYCSVNQYVFKCIMNVFKSVKIARITLRKNQLLSSYVLYKFYKKVDL